MAIKCIHADHSSADQQQKHKKSQPEEAQESNAKASEVQASPNETCNLVHLKHDWYDKGDIIVIHLYVKEVNKNLLDVILYEDELQVKFATSHREFLKMYSGTSENTLFSWNLKLRGNVDIVSSRSRLSKAFIELSLKKKIPATRWTGLERPNLSDIKKPATVASDRIFKQLYSATNKDKISHSQETLTNGIHNKLANVECAKASNSKESTNNGSLGNGSGTNTKEEVAKTSPEEKLLSDGDSDPSPSLNSSVADSCNACGSSTVDTENGQFTEECVPSDMDGDHSSEFCDYSAYVQSESTPNSGQLRTKSMHESTNIQQTSSDSLSMENENKNENSVPVCKDATSTAESLVTTFSSLSTSVQPSTSMSTVSSVSSIDLPSTSSSETAIPLPPPAPPSLPHLSSVRGCGDGQVKTGGVMGGNQNEATHLPFSEAIRAAASKNVGNTRDDYDGLDDSGDRAHTGLTGLDNLGNTCYLNSIVQCLANTRPLRDYFLVNKYEDDINTENPLGTGGKLAVSFAHVMGNLWSGKERSLSPYKLKGIVGEKVCQFKGFMQQDAQEFMAFLLDGLHEDLNRIKKKPYVEEVEGAGKPDAEVANEAWRRYKSRNDSVIVDLFQGQLKSKLTCPVCNKISIKYDPFMNLSVPLPKDQKILPVIIFFKDHKRVPLKVVLKLTQDACVEQLTAAVQRITAIEPRNMRVCEVFGGKFHRTFDRRYSLSSVISSDIIVVYEVLSEEEGGEEVYEVPIVQRTVCARVAPSYCASCYSRPGPGVALRRCTQCWGIGYCNQQCQKEHWTTHKKSCKRIPQHIGIPFIASIPASEATFQRLQSIAEEYAKYSVDVRPGEISRQNSLVREGETSSGETSPANDTSEEKGTDEASSPLQPRDGQPRFYVKPVTAYGEGIVGQEGGRLSDQGSELLDLGRKYLSIDWRNHPRSSGFVIAEEKDLECEEHSSCQTEKISESYSCSLKECLELFTEPETLSQNDAWYCPKCKAHREATKQLSVWRLPEILIIHLKRFSFRNILFKDKITKLVEFPLRGLDMSRFTLGKDDNEDKEGSLYDLFAVANHSGTVNFGHYTAFGRLAEADHPIDGLKTEGLGWRYFDDRSVTETTEERVISKYAYVLFYKRRSSTLSLQTHFEPGATPEELAEIEKLDRVLLEDIDENELD